MAPAIRPVVVPATGTSPAMLKIGSPTGARLRIAGLCVWGVRDYVTQGFGADQHKNRAQVINTVSAWGANLVRLRVLARDYNAQTHMPKAEYLKQVKDWRDAAVAKNMYFCVTWWDALDGGAAGGAQWATNYKNAFQMMTDVYKLLGDDPYVIYEPFNEPNNVTWDQWTPAMRDTISHFRGFLGYKGALAINTIQWSHGYDDARMTSLENYDAGHSGMNGKHQLMFCHHDYANEYANKKWDASKWIAGTGGSSTKHVILESEYGNYNGSPDTVNEVWSKDASAFFAARFKDSPNYAGAIPFLFGPWYDANAQTKSDNVTGTSWGDIARTSFLKPAGPTFPDLTTPEPEPNVDVTAQVTVLRARAASLRADAAELEAIADSLA